MPAWDKKKKADFPFDFDRIEQLMSELVDSLTQGNGIPEGQKPSFIGFSINFDSAGKPRFLGNPFKKRKPAEKAGKRDYHPLADVINEAKTITIALELRGAGEKSIRVSQPDEHTVKIEAGQKHKPFRKEMFFGEKLKKGFKSKFKNGVLEIVLEKNIANRA
ncbi:MAG: hypothetical protein HY394_04230 [Candidatus Diapherotrites archaeon]|nr:hypothetical protein [Candidatus Diapherotrites archaeon]